METFLTYNSYILPKNLIVQTMEQKCRNVEKKVSIYFDLNVNKMWQNAEVQVISKTELRILFITTPVLKTEPLYTDDFK